MFYDFFSKKVKKIFVRIKKGCTFALPKYWGILMD